MQHEQQYKELLAKNSAANNLLVLNLLQSQENWSKQKALVWVFQALIPTFQTLEQERLYYFGNTGLSFIFHHAELKDTVSIQHTSNANQLYEAVLICRSQNQKQSKLLYKIDYIEDAPYLLKKYKQHLLEHLEEIVRNFVAETD
jgi:hypothetical protein